jgi:hypothetical protein
MGNILALNFPSRANTLLEIASPAKTVEIVKAHILILHFIFNSYFLYERVEDNALAQRGCKSLKNKSLK